MELKTRLSLLVTDPRLGTRTVRLHILSREEPDPILFVRPPQYQVQDVRGQVASPQPPPAPGTERIGNGVSAPIVLLAPSPQYSDEARRLKISGNVLVHTVVDATGAPTQVKVVRGIGHGLDEKAVQTVQKYRFKPAIKDGQPVSVEINVEVNFQIF